MMTYPNLKGLYESIATMRSELDTTTAAAEAAATAADLDNLAATLGQDIGTASRFPYYNGLGDLTWTSYNFGGWGTEVIEATRLHCYQSLLHGTSVWGSYFRTTEKVDFDAIRFMRVKMTGSMTRANCTFSALDDSDVAETISGSNGDVWNNVEAITGQKRLEFRVAINTSAHEDKAYDMSLYEVEVIK